jgi:dipeptidase E
MKLLLCSQGFHTKNTVQALANLLGKPASDISFAIINEAYAMEEGDKRWMLHNLNCIADNFGGEIDFINLLALPINEVERRVMQRDVIFVVGGSADYLMSVFTKTGFVKLLPKLLKFKVYVGSSAGSMVVGKRLSTAAYRLMYGHDTGYGIDHYLELADFSIMPHMDSEEFPGRNERIFEAAKNQQGVIYGLRDDSAAIVNGAEVTFTGSKPYILGADSRKG